jgi:radical SAM superfamily enzyme YgiQ (UPF0313 family)
VKKILFVNPSYRGDVLEHVKVLSLPPLNLATLARCTPDTYDIAIIDEAMDTIDFDEDVDLVAITCLTPLAPRAYEISRRFRERGVPVVLGGVHASIVCEEATSFVNAVVIGEAEEIWQEVLQDYEAGTLRKTYRSSRPSPESVPLPRRDLFSNGYFIETVQTSRGCPFDCEFCSVTTFSGGHYRLRPVEDVIAEIGQLNGRRFFFVDDNIIGSGERSTRRAFRLFEELTGLGKQWGSQVCLSIVENHALLRAATRSGAKFFFIGFESIDAETLAAMNKQINLRPGTRNFKDAIKRIQDEGIAIVGSFILGNDTDNKDVFERTADFVRHTGIDGAQFTIQTPFPGTKLYRKLAAGKRLLFTNYPRDWRRYNGFQVVFQPKNMTVEELQEGHVSTYNATASLGTSLGRALRTFLRTKNVIATAASFYWNYDCYKVVTSGSL